MGADTLHGWRLNWETSNDWSEADLRQRLRAFPVGESVSVHYDPLNPASAVLETGGNDGGLMAWGVAFFLVVLAVVQDARARSA